MDQAGHQLDGPLVLLVDDSQPNRMICAEVLELDGFRVDHAETGLEALDKIAGDLPDAIVLDLSMPDMDGWEVLRRLRADPSARAIPILLISGHGLEEKTVLQAGCAAYLSKPFRLDELLATVRGIVPRPQR
jgi:CheY-like chemotaxis protein